MNSVFRFQSSTLRSLSCPERPVLRSSKSEGGSRGISGLYIPTFLHSYIRISLHSYIPASLYHLLSLVTLKNRFIPAKKSKKIQKNIFRQGKKHP